jgi:hypothetical protein
MQAIQALESTHIASSGSSHQRRIGKRRALGGHDRIVGIIAGSQLGPYPVAAC